MFSSQRTTKSVGFIVMLGLLTVLGGCGGNDKKKEDAVYVMLFDQTQTTIAGTPVGVAEDQAIDVELTAGLAYYVEVNGYNVEGYRYDYQLAVSQN